LREGVQSVFAMLVRFLVLTDALPVAFRKVIELRLDLGN
jgi:hypothetical protein